MRRAHLAAVVALLTLAGCTGTVPTEGPAATEDPTATTTAVWEPPAEPGPPATLTAERAEAAAILAEKVHVYESLGAEYDLTYLSVGYMYASQARVLNRSDAGAYVAVEVRYSYSNGEFVADGADSRALYHVNETAVRRVGGLEAYPATTVA